MFIDKARQAHIIHKYPRYVKWASSTYSNDINQVQHIFQYTMPTRFCYGGSLQIINWEKTISVVDRDSQSRICGGSKGSDHCACLIGSHVTGSDVTGSHMTVSGSWPEEALTGSDVITKSMFCTCPEGHSRVFFSYYSSTIVQVPWLPESTLPLGCAHAQPEVVQYPP